MTNQLRNNITYARKISYHLFLCICLLYCVSSSAQSNIKFTQLTNLDGLSQSTVQAIVKDKYGFMWFGTQDGLNRYDGYKFKVYRHKPRDSSSLRKSHILSLYEDRRGELWVGTSNGSLSLYDRKHDAFIHYRETIGNKPGLSQNSITAIYEDKQNNLWIGTYWKLNLLDRKTGKVTQFGNDSTDAASISNDGITSIFEDSHNNLWVGTTSGLNILDRKTKKFKRYFHGIDSSSLSDDYIRAIYEDSTGRLWVGTNYGLNMYQYPTGNFKRFQHISTDANSLGDNEITSIQEAGRGKLWIGTKSSLEFFDVDKNKFTHIQSNPNDRSTLSKNGNVTAMYRDTDGILWVGTYQGGINKYDKHLTYFDVYRNNPENSQSLSYNVVTSFAENPQGDMWIGTGGGALNLWKKNTNSFLRFNPDTFNKNSLANWAVMCLYQSKRTDYLWIGTYGSCIDRFDPVKNSFRHYSKGAAPNQLNNDAVYSVLEDSKGNIWMGTNGGGVNVLDQKTDVITKYMTDPNNQNSLTGNYVRCFYEDEKGNIWIGTTGGISVFNPSTGSFTNYNQTNTALESDVIFSIYKDSRGDMWIGTLGGGLNKLNPKSKEIKIYTTEEGLPDNTVNSIVEDRQGMLWLSTNNGLSRFDTQKQIFRNNGLNNGIQSFEFSQGAGIRTKTGDIIFGGVNGFNVIHPDNLIENKIVPPVVITGFKIFNTAVNVGGENSPLQQNPEETKEITLSYDQSIFSFEFAALSFTSPEKNNYAYRLEGFDKDWNYTGNSRNATYTNLSPGHYVFRVKAANSDGIWNEQGASVQIVIMPPFWQKWWFKVLAAAALIASITLLYKSRIGAINAQKILLEEEVNERTRSLASMTLDERKARQEADEANKELERKNMELEQFAYVASHDLQEPLRTTSSFAEILQKQYHGKLDEKADKSLTYIIQATERMKILIHDLLDHSRIGTKKELTSVDCNTIVKEVIADLDVAINESGARIEVEQLPVISGYSTEMKQLFQNLVINAIKFRKKDIAPLIRISSEKTNGHWTFAVKDNGIGIDPQHSDRIFVIFQRLHTRDEYQGSGIGLSNCKKIVELHKGKIWIEPKAGEGSTFLFTIRDNNLK